MSVKKLTNDPLLRPFEKVQICGDSFSSRLDDKVDSISASNCAASAPIAHVNRVALGHIVGGAWISTWAICEF
jgi:hypothetical protein